MIVYGYCRVSTAGQADTGESLEVQQRKLTLHCELQGWPAPQLYVDAGVSAATPLHKRPQGAEILAKIKPGDVLLACKLDRAFRSALDALSVREDFMRRGIELCFLDIGEVTKGAVGSLFFMILAAVSEAERLATGDRTRTVKTDQRARGRFLGGAVPFGYRVVDGHLVENEPQQAALAQARRWKAESNLSNRQLAAKLSELGFKVSHVTLGKLL